MDEFGPDSRYSSTPEQAEASIQQSNDELAYRDDLYEDAAARLEQMEDAGPPEGEDAAEWERTFNALDDEVAKLEQDRDSAAKAHFANVEFWDQAEDNPEDDSPD